MLVATHCHPLPVSLISKYCWPKALHKVFEGVSSGGERRPSVRGANVEGSLIRLDELDAADEKLKLEP